MKPVETETQRVFDTIKAQILRQQLPAGTPLSHSQLCRDLQTSRTPVREAIRKLEGLGLVATLPHRGSFVAQLALRDFLEITQIRALLEPFAVREATGKVPEPVLLELTTRLRGLSREHPGAAEFSALHLIDADIHRVIGLYSGNARLNDLAENLRSLCQQFSYDSQLRYTVMIDELLALLGALRKGDAERAETLMRQHINNFGAALPGMVAR